MFGDRPGVESNRGSHSPNTTIYQDVTIGRNSVIHSGTVIRERSVIGQRVIIHNSGVGCDWFGYAKDESDIG